MGRRLLPLRLIPVIFDGAIRPEGLVQTLAFIIVDIGLYATGLSPQLEGCDIDIELFGDLLRG